MSDGVIDPCRERHRHKKYRGQVTESRVQVTQRQCLAINGLASKVLQ